MLTALQKRKLIRLFTIYDADNSGRLSLIDFKRIAQRLAELRDWSYNSPEYNDILSQFSLDWLRIKEEADIDRDHKVTLEEWLAYYDQVLTSEDSYHEELQNRFEIIYDIFDQDGDGEIGLQEWIDFCRAYNVPIVYAPNIFQSLDRNGNGFLCKREVLQMFHDFYFSDNPEAPGNWMLGPY